MLTSSLSQLTSSWYYQPPSGCGGITWYIGRCLYFLFEFILFEVVFALFFLLCGAVFYGTLYGIAKLYEVIYNVFKNRPCIFERAWKDKRR